MEVKTGTAWRADNITQNMIISNVVQYGQCVQDGTPSPATPIPVTGKAAGLTVYKKNLANQEQLLTATGWTYDGEYYSGTTNYLYSKFGSDGRYFLEIPPYDGQVTVSSMSYVDEVKSWTVGFRYTDGTLGGATFRNTAVERCIATSQEGKTVYQVYLTYGARTTLHIKDLQIELGSIATDYEPYTAPITQTVTDANGDSVTLYGVPVTSGGNVTIGAQQYVADTLSGDTATRRVGHIPSYNGEAITTAYISDTGELSTGADVYYVLDTPTTETVTMSPETLTANSPTTTWLSEAYSEVTLDQMPTIGKTNAR